MKLCEFNEHKWLMDIEDGEAHLRCADRHSDEEIEAMVTANDGREPACAMVDYIDKLDIHVYDIPISLNYYWQPGGHEDPLDGESVAEIEILPSPGVMHPVDSAFYNLTVNQRDSAWREIERLREIIEYQGPEIDRLRGLLHADS